MATADQLLELIFSWIEQRERCAEQLRKLAQELESLREKCNASECVGSTVSVVGAACLIGAGVATVFTAGAAAPFLGVLGAAYSGVGVTISVVTKITEHFSSSNTMKEAQKIEKNNNEIADKIQRLFQQLKAERKAASSFADPDELDQHIMMEILRAMARRSGLKWHVNIRMLDNEPQFFFDAGPRNMRLNQIFFKPEVIVGLAGILTFFTFQVSGKKFKLLFAKGAEQLIKQMSTTGFKTALKGGAMVVGGAVGLAFALPEAIDNWKDLIKKNHVTEASQSLRDTANAILKISRTLREQFNDMKKMFDEMAKIQQEHEEKSDVEDEESDQEDDGEDEESDQEDDGEDEESDQEDVESDGEDEESDQEDEESDGEDEESDQEDEESDGEDEESDQEDEESDSEEETEDDESKQIGKKMTKRRRKKETESKEIRETKEVTDQCQDSCIGQDQKSDHSINEESNHKFETNQRPPAIRVGLSNVRSMNNKTSRISELITQNNLDVFLTTETWLQEDTGDSILREASPQNFNFNHQVRGSRGGGVAIQFSQKLQGEHILFGFVTTFECVATVLQYDEWDEPVLIINVYHPPGYNLTQFRAFLNEFQMLLDDVSKVYNSIIVTGDFNIWVDNERRTSTDEFEFLLLINDLDQHVEEPTHQAGHFLDLVITRNVEIYSLFVRDDDISDHYTVYFNARPVSTDTKEETEENMEQDEQAKRFKKREE